MLKQRFRRPAACQVEPLRQLVAFPAASRPASPRGRGDRRSRCRRHRRGPTTKGFDMGLHGRSFGAMRAELLPPLPARWTQVAPRPPDAKSRESDKTPSMRGVQAFILENNNSGGGRRTGGRAPRIFRRKIRTGRRAKRRAPSLELSHENPHGSKKARQGGGPFPHSMRQGSVSAALPSAPRRRS